MKLGSLGVAIAALDSMWVTKLGTARWQIVRLSDEFVDLRCIGIVEAGRQILRD